MLLLVVTLIISLLTGNWIWFAMGVLVAFLAE